MKLYNPLTSDFSFDWRDDYNIEQTLTIKAMDIASFPETQGNFLAKHLADEIVQKKGIKKNFSLDHQEAMAEILKFNHD